MYAVTTRLCIAALLAAAAAGQRCVTSGVHIIAARGTMEPQGEGKMAIHIGQIMSDIPGSDVDNVVYPANLDQPNSGNQGTTDMLLRVTRYAQSCPGSKMVLMGYSQGAYVVANAVGGGGVRPWVAAPDGADTPALPSEVMNKGMQILDLDIQYLTSLNSGCHCCIWRHQFPG